MAIVIIPTVSVREGMLSETAIVAIVLSSVAIAAASIAVAVLACLGAFRRPAALEAGTLDAQTFVYRTRRGDYSGMGSLYSRVRSFLCWHGLGRLTVAAIYYDDPAWGCPCGDDFRYAVGFLIDPGDGGALAKWEALRNTPDGTKYSVLEIPGNTTTLVSSFPIRCYPSWNRWIASRKAFRTFAREDHEFWTGCLQVYRWQQQQQHPNTIETHFPRNNLGTFRARSSDPFPRAPVALA